MGFGPQICFGGDSGGGGGGGGNDDNDNQTTTTTPTRTTAQVQADINSALDASGGAWTAELNDLVTERNDAADTAPASTSSSTTTSSSTSSGGTSNADAYREYASSMLAAGQTNLSGTTQTTPTSFGTPDDDNLSDYEREAFGTDQATFYNNQTDDTPASVTVDDTPSVQPASSGGNAVTDFLNTYVLGENTQIGGDDDTTPAETNAERVTRETIQELVNTGQISAAQANDPSTSGGVVDMLNSTGVPSVKLTEAGSNPLLSDTMGIGSDGRLLDAVTGATDGGANRDFQDLVENSINTVGTPVVTSSANTGPPSMGFPTALETQIAENRRISDEALAVEAAKPGSGFGGLLKAGAQKGGELAVDAAANIIDYFDPAQTYGYGYNQGIPQLDSSGNVIPEIDFGFARALGENPQQLSQITGTDNQVANVLKDVSDDIGAASAATLAGISDTTLGKAKNNPVFGTGGFGPDPTALLAEVIYGAPIVGSVAATTIANPVAGVTLGATLTVGELSNEVESRVQAKIDAGEFGPVSANQAETIKKGYVDSVIPLAVASGAVESLGFTKLVPGGLGGQILASSGLGALEEGVSEPTITESVLAGEFTPTGDADAAIVGGVLGGGATTLTASQRNALSGTSNVTGTGGTPSGIQTVTTPSGGSGGTGLTSAQRTAISDTTGIAGAVAPTVMSTGPGQPGSNVGAANQTSPQVFTQDGTVLDAQPVISTPTGPVQPGTNQDVIDAVFTDIVPPNVTTTAPAQIAAPDASVASGVISGTPTTDVAPVQTQPLQLSPPSVTDVAPSTFTQIVPPSVNTSINQITIPGTDITVDVPALQTPTTDPAVNTAQPSGLAALGTGGAFNPNVSNLPASVTASPIAQPVTETAATDAVSQEQSIIDTIAQEVAQEGGLTIETAQEIAAANNLSVQEVATLAENAMGVPDQIRSIATGPSTSLVPASSVALDAFGGPGTNVVPLNTANTGIATLDTTQSEVGGLQGEILDADNAVVTRDTSPAIESPIIEGTTSSMEVDAANPTETEVFINEGEVITPTDVTTEVNVPVNENVTIDGTTNTTEVVVTDPNTTRPVVVQTPPVVEQVVTEPETVVDTTFVQPVVQPDDDDDDITVEVDEPVDVDGDDDVVVEIDPPVDDDDDDDGPVAEEDAPFECPEGFVAVQINGEWRCQMEDDMPERVRPTGGAYYRPNPNPNYGARAARTRTRRSA